MATFPRGTVAALPARHRRFLARAAQAFTAAADVAPPRTPLYVDPADSHTLRGIPAIGRGVAGHMAQTQPESHVCR